MIIIQCPSCDTKFKVNENELNAHGRFVRCSKCEYEWLFTPENDTANNYSTSIENQENKLSKISATKNSSTKYSIIGDKVNEIKMFQNKRKFNSFIKKIMNIIIFGIGALATALLMFFLLILDGEGIITKYIPIPHNLLLKMEQISFIQSLNTKDDIKITDFEIFYNENENKYNTIIELQIQNYGSKIKIIEEVKVIGYDSQNKVLFTDINRINKILYSKQNIKIESYINIKNDIIKRIEVYLNNNILDYNLLSPKIVTK